MVLFKELQQKIKAEKGTSLKLKVGKYEITEACVGLGLSPVHWE